MTKRYQGGCLCGAVRYEIIGYDRAVNCHCAMCRKATGAAFATWVCLLFTQFKVTGGEPEWRRSSDKCRRGFCGACGSALFMRYDADDEIAVSVGTLDASDFEPTYSIWVADRLPWTSPVDAHLRQFPGDPDD